MGYPFKVTTKSDIETAAILNGHPPGAVGHYSMMPLIVSGAIKALTRHIYEFTEECMSQGGTTKIFDVDDTEAV